MGVFRQEAMPEQAAKLSVHLECRFSSLRRECVSPPFPAPAGRVSSYGSEQLEWAAEQLKGGKPTVAVFHFPLPASLANEVPGGRWPDLAALLAAHGNVKLAVSGHFHKVTTRFLSAVQR
jgi:hypothetical protein